MKIPKPIRYMIASFFLTVGLAAAVDRTAATLHYVKTKTEASGLREQELEQKYGLEIYGSPSSHELDTLDKVLEHTQPQGLESIEFVDEKDRIGAYVTNMNVPWREDIVGTYTPDSLIEKAKVTVLKQQTVLEETLAHEIGHHKHALLSDPEALSRKFAALSAKGGNSPYGTNWGFVYYSEGLEEDKDGDFASLYGTTSPLEDVATTYELALTGTIKNHQRITSPVLKQKMLTLEEEGLIGPGTADYFDLIYQIGQIEKTPCSELCRGDMTERIQLLARTFLKDHPNSTFRPQVVELLYDEGLASDF